MPSTAGDGLSEPLLEEVPPGAMPRPVRGARSSGAPVPWIEWEPNGRGLAATTAFCLGVAFAVSATCMPMLIPSASPFFCYFSLLCIFHLSEYLLTAAFRPDTLSFDNFLLNHSKAYQLMVIVAWVEYWLEWVAVGHFGCCSWWPGGKSWGALNVLGLLICLVGLGTRCLGMATASTNFSHRIEEHKRAEHTLVTHGIYAYLRHPAYFGFFWWSVGTQVLLGNPIAVLAYTAASWHFFYDRIPVEEELLVEFFGEQYLRYRKQTSVGIPLIDWATRPARYV